MPERTALRFDDLLDGTPFADHPEAIWCEEHQADAEYDSAHNSAEAARARPAARASIRHVLNTDREVFGAVLRGEKTAEIRLDDRDFRVGDELQLLETVSTSAEMRAVAPLEFTGREAIKTISHVLRGYGLLPGWVCLSILDTRAQARPND